MTTTILWLALVTLTIGGYFGGRARAIASVSGNEKLLHSRPNYYGWNVVVFTLLPALLAYSVFLVIDMFMSESNILGIGSVISILVGLVGLLFAVIQTKRDYR